MLCVCVLDGERLVCFALRCAGTFMLFCLPGPVFVFFECQASAAPSKVRKPEAAAVRAEGWTERWADGQMSVHTGKLAGKQEEDFWPDGQAGNWTGQRKCLRLHSKTQTKKLH